MIRRFKIYQQLLLGFLFISSMPSVVFLGVTYYYDSTAAKRSLDNAVRQGERRINTLLEKAEATLMDVAEYVDYADPNAVEQLQKIVYDEPLFREIGLINTDDYLVVTNLGRIDPPRFVKPEERSNPDDRSLQILGPFKTAIMQEESLILALPIDQGEVNVLVDPSILIADWGSSIPLELGPGGYFAYISKNTGQILSSLGDLPTGDISTLDGQEHYFQAMATSQRDDVLVVGGVSKSSIFRRWREQLLIVIPISVLCSGLLMVLLARLMKQSMALDHDLRIGLKNQELVAHYQPVVDLETGQYVGIEALLRWYHPQQGVLSPNLFIPIAEQTGLINLIGEWLIKTAAQEYADLFQAVPGFYISINVSPIQIRSGSLDQVITWLRNNNVVSPERFVFEVTESVIVHNYGTTASDALARLRQLGGRISLDDFGTGYSGLNYLHQFQVDQIKLDRFYVAAIHRDPLLTHILETIIDLGHKLEVTLVAEGIETEEQRQFLRERGVQYGQGWLFARPMPLQETKAAIYQNRATA